MEYAEVRKFKLPNMQKEFEIPAPRRTPLVSHEEVAAILAKHDERLGSKKGKKMMAQLRKQVQGSLPRQHRGGGVAKPPGKKKAKQAKAAKEKSKPPAKKK